MSKPINRKIQRRRYFYIGLALYLIILYFGCHLGHVSHGRNLSPRVINEALAHCSAHPFELFPTDATYMGAAALVGFIAPLLIYTEYLRNRDTRPMVESGSARWNEDFKAFYDTYTDVTTWPRIFESSESLRKVKESIQKFNKKVLKIPVIGFFYNKILYAFIRKFERPSEGTGSENMIFSKDISMSMNTRKTQRNNNVVCIGGSGTGKSRFLVKPNILNANSSFIVTDPSGELLETQGQFLISQGYELRVFNLVEMGHSCCYNPFHYIRNQEGVLVMINALIKNTTPKGSSTSDPFWEKAETALLQAICFYLVSECNEEDQNFSNVMKLLRCAKAVEGQENVDSVLDIMFKDLAEKDPEHIAVQSYAVFKSAGGGKTAQSILISCQTRLQTFNLDAIRNLTSTDNIDLGSVGDKKVALFCITPSADTTFNYLIALMYTQLFETLYFHAETECPGKRLPNHVRFLLDEFANVGTIPDFPQKLSTMRKYEISCTIILQALSQIKAMYKDDWEVLLGNCDSMLFLGGNDQTTLDYISKRLGKETIRSINNSRSYGRQGSHTLSYNKTGRELMTADELAVMKNKNCILIIRGEYPFFTTKYPLEKHPNYKLCGDGNKELMYDVKEQLHTGENISLLKTRENMPLKVFKDAQISDTRESVHEHRYQTRPLQEVSVRGREFFRNRPLSEEFPGIEIPPNERTPEEEVALSEASNMYAVDAFSSLTEENMDKYQELIYGMNFGDPEFEEVIDELSDSEKSE